MSDRDLLIHAAPTLAGRKTANLFLVPYESEEELRYELREYNLRLKSMGLCLIPVRKENGKALLYLYRPDMLKRDLSGELARKILAGAGYEGEGMNSTRCVCRLIQKLADKAQFPHEIGIFLGYPPEDVQGFIENHAENFKCAGLWKVYSDVPRAQRMFREYRTCTALSLEQWKQGYCMEEIVANLS